MQIPIWETSVDASGRELMEHGAALFSIAVYRDDLTRAEALWHWHDELKAAVVTEGSAVFATDRERVALHTGDGCFINANVLHGAWNVGQGRPCRLHSLVFHPRLIGGSAESVFWQKYLLPVTENRAFQLLALCALDADDTKPLVSIETAWRVCAEEPAGFEFLVHGELSRLLLFARESSDFDAEEPSVKRIRDERRMKVVLTYIRAKLPEELTVERIASAASVSERACIRCFRGMIGTTPIRYVKQLRLQRAAGLLAGRTEGYRTSEMPADFRR